MADDQPELPDVDPADLAAKASAAEIKPDEATPPAPRGNIYSEEEEGEPGHVAPPPYPS